MNLFEKIIEFIFGSDTLSAEKYFERGNSAYRNEHISEALRYFLKAYELDPRNVRYKASVARAYLALGKTNEARNITLEILKTYPNYDYARQLLNKIDPGVSKLNFRFPELQDAQSHVPISVLKSPRKISSNPNFNLTAPPLWSHWHKVYVLVQQGDLEEALNQTLASIHNSSNLEYGYYILGYIYDRLGQQQDAANAYRNAIRLGRSGSVHNRLARVSALLNL